MCCVVLERRREIKLIMIKKILSKMQIVKKTVRKKIIEKSFTIRFCVLDF